MTTTLRGGTALITGASSGLGAEFAKQFAKRGSNLVLVARRKDRLDQLAAELRSAWKIDVEVIAQDLAVPGAADEIRRALDAKGFTVTSLVNNAGFGSHGRFDHADSGRIAREIQLNVSTLTLMTHSFIHDLLRGEGALINVASTAAYQPTPGMAVYGATKAYVLSFTEAIWAEAQGTRLRVLAISPGPTETEFFDVVGSTAAAVGRYQTPAQVVQTAMQQIEGKRNRPSIVSGTANHLTASTGRFLSRRATARTTARVMGNVRMSA